MCATCGCQSAAPEVTYVQPQAVQPSAADIMPAGQPGGYDVQAAPVAADPVAVAPVAVDPVSADPVAVAPVAVDPVAAQPVVDPLPSGNIVQPLISVLDKVPANSPQAAEILDIIHSQNHQADVWLQPSHDIYGNPL